MPIIREPLKAQCFRCKKWFFIKYVSGRKGFSKKNDWDYWTEDKDNVGKKICNECLKHLYKKEKYEFHKLVKSKKLRQLLSNYISLGRM